MREMIARHASRFAALGMAFAIVSVLGGCGSLAPTWDPTDLMDFLDSKKRAPGERKPVVPEGVPGITQGVPKDMVRGSAESRATAEAQAAAAAPPPPPQPAAPPAKRSRTAAKQPPQSQVEIAPDDVNVGEEPPPPPPRRQAQRPQRAAPPPQQQVEPQQQANPFPAPLPR